MKPQLTLLNPSPIRPIMMRPPFRLMLVARSQTGKTTLLIKLLNFYWLKEFDFIHIFCPTYGQDLKWSSLDKYINKKVFVHPTVDENIIKGIWTRCKQNKEAGKKRHTLILFDDCTGQEGFCKNQNSGLINQLVCRGNHANISTGWSVQKFTQSSTTMRSQAEGLITFSCLAEKDQKAIHQEFGLGKFTWFQGLLHNATFEPYHYLYINRQGPGTPDYYHNFKFITDNETK